MEDDVLGLLDLEGDVTEEKRFHARLGGDLADALGRRVQVVELRG